MWVRRAVGLLSRRAPTRTRPNKDEPGVGGSVDLTEQCRPSGQRLRHGSPQGPPERPEPHEAGPSGPPSRAALSSTLLVVRAAPRSSCPALLRGPVPPETQLRTTSLHRADTRRSPACRLLISRQGWMPSACSSRPRSMLPDRRPQSTPYTSASPRHAGRL